MLNAEQHVKLDFFPKLSDSGQVKFFRQKKFELEIHCLRCMIWASLDKKVYRMYKFAFISPFLHSIFEMVKYIYFCYCFF